MKTSFRIVSLGVVVALAPACSSQGSSTAPAAQHAPAATPAAIPDRDMIVLLREQFTALDARPAAAPARATAIKASHAHLVTALQAAKPRNVVSFQLVNGFAARLSQAEIDSLGAKPEVLAVVPDRAIPAPRRHAKAARGASGSAASPTDGGSVAALCNTLEPEALQLTNTAFLDPTVPQAQSVVDGNGQPVTGSGVTVGFIADGIDPNIPGFIRADGSKVFVDYQDFSGDPATLATSGAEAFGDASSIAAQDVGPNGPVQYDIAAYGYGVNGMPTPCNVRIRGMAPGASLVGLKAIASNGFASESALVQALEWAVVHDHVNVLNESLGGMYVPDTDNDPFSLANAAAVRAGVIVTVSSGDAGSTNTLNTPSTDPYVISAGATTQYRAYAQTGIDYGGLGWVDDNMAAFSSGGFAQARPRTIDLVAPGNDGWAYCSTNQALFNGCSSFSGEPTQIELFGGTSEAAPLAAGAAALVIQAYRSTHNGASPSPALVKRILMSTARDIGAPSDEQGAGIVDALAAVNTALSIQDGDGAPQARAGAGLVVSPNAVPIVAEPGRSLTQTFHVTNAGTTALHLQPALQQLGPSFAGQTVSVPFDATRATAVVQTFTVPAGADHLDVSIGYAVPPPPGQAAVGFELLDPQNRLAVDSYPQGSNSGYGNVDVAAPAAGTWTAVLYSGSYAGPVQFTWAAEKYVALGSVSPSSLNVAPGATASVTATFQAPSQPGDLAAALRFSGASVAEIPVTVRTLVPVGARGGAFTGTLTGGNGRQGISPTETYAFDVPPGVGSLALSVTLPEGGYGVAGFLVNPHAMVLDVASTLGVFTPEGGQPAVVPTGTALQLLRAAPEPGRWSLMLQQTQAAGNETSVQFAAGVAFDTAAASASLPNSPDTQVSAAAGTTVTVDVTNSGVATAAYFVDPRLQALASVSLPTTLCTATTPATLPGTCRTFVAPTETSVLVVQAQSSAPIMMDTGPSSGGSPDLFGLPAGPNTVAAFLVAPEVPFASWFISPSLVGPFPAAGAPTTPVTTSATALVQAFDPAVSSSAGNYWADVVNGTSTFRPLVLAPGASGQIAVTLKPDASSVGQLVRGTLYVDTFNGATDPVATGDEVVALPYAYTVAP